MIRLLRASIVLSVCLAGAVTLAPSSYADRMTHRDARHDVMRFTQNGDIARVPHARDPDVIRTKVAHRAHRVVFKLRFANLRRHMLRMNFADIRTPRDNFSLVAFTSPSTHRNNVRLRGDNGVVLCPKLRYQLRDQRESLRVAVPRTCLDTPRWVQVGVGVIRRYRHSDYYDDALRRGTSSGPRMTRKLYRG